MDWRVLSRNKNAIELLIQHPDKIDWENLSGNINAIQILRQYPEKINWDILSRSANSEYHNCETSVHYLQLIELLDQYPDKVVWTTIDNKNPNVVELLKKHPDKINWNQLSKNKNAIGLLRENMDKIDWDKLSANENAIELLAENPENINWDQCIKLNDNYDKLLSIVSEKFEIDEKIKNDILIYREKMKWNDISQETTDIELLRANLDKINWVNLVLNQCPDVIQILKENPDKISWRYVFSFTCDINSELLAKNPDNYDFFDLTINPGIVDIMRENKHCANDNYFASSPLIFEIDINETKRKINKFVLKIFNLG